MSKLMSHGYFAQVVEAMQGKGFTLFSQVEISTDDFQYHVSAKIARVTSLFFHAPNKNLIIRLAYYEQDYEGKKMEGYWHIRVDAEFSAQSSVDTFFYGDIEEGADIFPGEKPLGKIECAGFVESGWSSCGDLLCTWNLEQRWPDRSLLDSQDLASRVHTMAAPMLPFLKSAPFEKHQVTSWPPEYVFKGCSSVFWERFKESSAKISSPRYLWSLIEKPWGSDGLKR